MGIKIGDKCPDFSLLDQNGEMVTIKEIIGEKNIVIYFYPKDNTWGCTKQACTFRDSFQDFIDLGCEVIGISTDSVDSHKLFSTKYNLNFKILSDVDFEVIDGREVLSIANNFSDNEWQFQKFQNFIFNNIAQTSLSKK